MRYKLITIIFFLCLYQSAAQADTRTITENAIFGCKSQSQFERIFSYLVQGDKKAWNKAMIDALLSDNCTYLTTGEEVFIRDIAIFSGMIKIRLKGSLDEYWTNIEAVSK